MVLGQLKTSNKPKIMLNVTFVIVYAGEKEWSGWKEL